MAAKFSKLFAATCLAGLGTPQIVSAEISIFELRITNNTDRDLTFKLKADHSKKVDLTYDKKYVPKYTIKAGTSKIIGIKPDGDKCAPTCGVCSPAYGKVYAYYKDDNGKEQRNDYHKASVEFFEYCGVAAGKPLTTYTSNWAFQHHKGKGTGRFKHTVKSSHNNYTKSDPARGLTMDAKKIKGQATIVYSVRK